MILRLMRKMVQRFFGAFVFLRFVASFIVLRRKYPVFVLLLALFLSLGRVEAQQQAVSKEDIISALLFSFFKYVEWPREGELDQFTIALLGADNNLTSIMKEPLDVLKVRNRTFRIITVDSLDKIPASEIQMLYVANRSPYKVRDIAKKISRTDTLLVTEMSDNKYNTMINLVYNESNIDFEVNRANILLEKLELDKEVLLLGGTELDIAVLLEELEVKTDKLAEELIGRTDAIKLLEEKQRNLNNLLDKKQKEVEVKEKNLSAKEKEILEKENLLASMQTKFNAIETDYLRKREELNKNKLDLAKNKDALDRVLQDLNNKENKVSQLVKEIDENVEKLRLQKNTLAQQVQLIGVQRHWLAITVSFLCLLLFLFILLLKINKDRKASNLELKFAKERAQQYLDVAGSLIVVVDDKSTIRLINKKGCKIFGYSAEDMIGQSLVEAYMPEALREKNYQILERIKSGSVKEGEVFQSVIVNSAGEHRDILWAASVYMEEKINEPVIIASGEDCTERLLIEEQRNRAKEEAILANNSKTIFLSNMSHELRTPLNAIMGFTQVILQDEDLSAVHKRDLETVNRSGKHLLSLINDVLDLSKIESGHTNISSASFNLSSVLFDIHSLFVLRAKSQDLDLVVNTEFPSSQFIVSDEGKIRQVLINLISNAIKYTEQGGVYVNAILSSNESGNNRAELTIDVVDTGVGIAESDKVRVFNAFQQAEKPILKRGGTGLGLAISSQYAELLGGQLLLESQLGRGSKFSFTIPVELSVGVESAPGKQFDRVEKLDAEFLGLKVLAVDDLESNNELLKRLLTPLGFDVKTALDGNTAIELFQSWHPEIMLVDRVMPGIDGLEVTEKIRALPRGKDVVIICVSASVFEGERQAVFDSGANDFLTKPFENEALLELIYKHSHVKYVYAGGTDARGRDNLHNNDDIDTIAKLPLDILERLCRVEHKESMLSMISEIADADAMLAIRLWELVENSSTSAMKEMLKRAYSQASKVQPAPQL